MKCICCFFRRVWYDIKKIESFGIIEIGVHSVCLLGVLFCNHICRKSVEDALQSTQQFLTRLKHLMHTEQTSNWLQLTLLDCHIMAHSTTPPNTNCYTHSAD